MNKDRLVNTFMDLVRIGSESKNEGPFQTELKKRLRDLGVSVRKDDTMEETGLGADNLYARLQGTDNDEPIFFSCHVDTVAPGNGINPRVEDGVIRSDGNTILGADDKAGIAAILEAIQILKESGEPHRTLEFVFSPGEEIGLVGASAFDTAQLQSSYGFVLDSAGPVGGVTVASPTLCRVEMEVHGKSAHAGLEPENGVSAITIAAKGIANMKLGRIDDTTTANIGTIEGGTATNVVADHATITAEARAISDEATNAQVQHMIAAVKEAAEEMGGTAEAKISILSQGYELKESDPVVQLAFDAIRAVGRTPHVEISGGGSDANIFNAAGIPTANLSVGYEHVHTLEEYLPVEELVAATQLVCQLAKPTR